VEPIISQSQPEKIDRKTSKGQRTKTRNAKTLRRSHKEKQKNARGGKDNPPTRENRAAHCRTERK